MRVQRVVVAGALLFARAAGDLAFAGNWSDARFPGCPRSIAQANATAALIYGSDPAAAPSSPAADGAAAACDGRTDAAWGPCAASVSGCVIVAEFAACRAGGAPGPLEGTYSDHTGAIDWADGGAWTRPAPP